MQENEFEKQVKITMDDFRLRPSGPVWSRIREEIRDKRRRRVLLLIPVMAAMLALGYYSWQSFYGSDKNVSQKELLLNDKTKNKEPDSKSPALDHPVGITKAITPPVTGKPAPLKNEDLPNDNPLLADKKTVSHNPYKTGKGNQFLQEMTGERKNHSTGDENEKNSGEQKEWLQDDKLVTRQDISTDNQRLQVPLWQDDPPLAKLEPDNKPVIIDHNLPLTLKAELMTADKSTLIITMPAKNEQDLKRTGKLKWGFVFSFGGSSRYEKAFTVGSADKSSTPAANYLGSPSGVGSGTGNVAGGLLVLPPSNVKPGTAFKAGFMVDKPISGRVDITTGLQYAYTSDRITIGKKIYSTGNYTLQDRNYFANAVAQTSYSGMQPQNYTNRYHFVELPVMVHVNLTGKWKVPVTWNAGASISRLISTNVLLYNEAWGGVYYRGKEDLSKTQVSVATGFSVRIKGHNQWQWNIGPQVSINTTKLFQSSSDKNKHIVYGAIELRLLFPGKKK